MGTNPLNPDTDGDGINDKDDFFLLIRQAHLLSELTLQLL